MDYEYKAQYEELDESFMREYKDELDWYLVCQYQVLTEDFMREMIDYLDFFQISQYQVLSDVFIRDYAEELNWTALCVFQILPESLMRDYHEKLNWGFVSVHQRLSTEFIHDFQEEFDWSQICIFQTLSEADIMEFHERLDPAAISTYQRLTDTIILEHRDRLDWTAICQYQSLSPELLSNPLLLPYYNWEMLQQYQTLDEEFIRANLPKLNNLSYQLSNVSLEFIKNFSRNFDIYYSLENFQFPTDVLSEFRHLISDFWFHVSRFQILNTDFIRYFRRELTWAELSKYQLLDEALMEEFYSLLDVSNIWMFQQYSDDFILAHLDDANWNTISYNRIVTHPSLIDNVVTTNNWLYVAEQEKINALAEAGYTLITPDGGGETRAIAYKILDKNMRSYDYNRWYSFVVGGTNTAICNFNTTNDDTTGIRCNRLSAINALYTTGTVVRVLIPLSAIVLLEDGTVRCSSLFVQAITTPAAG